MPLANPRQAKIKALIDDFLQERLNSKLEKLAEDSPKRQDEYARFERNTWLADAARRAQQIEVATHIRKATNPDAKGINCNSPPASLYSIDVVGSHCLNEQTYALDVVGNAAALDVFSFLKLECEGKTLLEMAQQQDPDFAAVLNTDLETAQAWMQAFLLQSKVRLASHTLSKQVYWPIDESDRSNDEGFHLLGPLYASSLAQVVYECVQADRFGEDAKAARAAKKAQTMHPTPVRSYPHMAIQKFGGTKPQNISLLNSKRGGNNYLFASLPPQWKSQRVRPLFKSDNMFQIYAKRAEVKWGIESLATFLSESWQNNEEARAQRADYVDKLAKEFLLFTLELRELEPGWSQSADCALSDLHKTWLDPQALAQGNGQFEDGHFSPSVLEEISKEFARWLNASLNASKKIQGFGNAEYLEWYGVMLDILKEYERENSYV